jgi:anti-sigma regulatory factor (Ser/Thr protein kinase)/GNAT superfamily N-acetyltransferase
MATRTNTLPTRPTVPADRRFLYMVQGYVRELSAAAGLSEEEIQRLELAAEEAFMNVVENAYPGLRPGGIFVTGEIGYGELMLSIRDEGVPLDKLPEDGPDINRGIEGTLPHGIGLKRISNAVDEACFENLGHRGKALRLVKRLSRAEEVQPGPMIEEAAAAPPQRYEIRPLRFEDAVQIPRLFWLSYGYTYKIQDFYRPEGLLHWAASGRVTSFVAVAESGEVVGHAGMLRYGPLPIAEMALLVVDPAHRGRGLMGALHDALEKRAGEMGLRGVCFDAITSHAISQWDVVRFGGKICDLELSAGPPHVFRALVDNQSRHQRESCLHCFKYLSPPPEAVVHAPPHHREMISRIYGNLEQSWRPGDAGTSRRAGDFHVHFDGTMLKGVITVVSADESRWPEISRVTRDLIKYAGTEVVYLDLPLAQPVSVKLCEEAEKEGYFFAGVRPLEAADGDNLRLQCLAAPLDMTRLCIGPEFGRELYNYVAARMKTAP